MEILKLIKLVFWILVLATTILCTLVGIGNIVVLILSGIVSMYLSISTYESIE